MNKGIDELVALPGGTFRMGSDDGVSAANGEAPVRAICLAPFAIAPHAVTNAQFAAFVNATGYVTDAERAGASFVFVGFLDDAGLARVRGVVADTPWWAEVQGACWSAPCGPDASQLAQPHGEVRTPTLAAPGDHPVVHVSHHDARAFCAWAGARLPTEAEWEYAARGGLDQRRYPWGDEQTPNGAWRCNVWQGEFPSRNTAADRFLGTAPVDAYPPNGYGLHNMVGNVWEWCADWFAPGHDPSALQDPTGPGSGTERVIRGGSYLCHESYCFGYRVAARSSNTPESSAGHMGFRLARSQ